MANPLSNLLNFKKLGLWQSKDNQVIGLDIGHASVKAVQLKKEHGRVILETYGEIAMGPYAHLAVGQVANLNNATQAELLKDLFKEANITSKTVAMAIPLRSSLLVILDLPDVGAAKLAKIVPIEARKYVPVPISEVELDWFVLPQIATNDQAESRRIEVLLAAIHKDVINRNGEIARLAGLNLSFFEIETFSAIRSIFAGDLNPLVILDIGAATTKMAIVDRGIARLSHTISKGSQDVTMAISRSLGVDFAKAEEIKRSVGLVRQETASGQISGVINTILEYIFSEVNKVTSTYQAKSRRTVSKIVLIGGGSGLAGLHAVAQKSFDVPVVIGNPFETTDYPPFLKEVLVETGPGFAVAIGIALRYLQDLE